MNVIELRRQRAAALDAADAILNAALAEGRALSDEQTSQVQGYKAQAERLTEQETLADSITSMRGKAQGPVYHQRPTPDTPEGIFCRVVRTNDPGAVKELRASNDTTMNITTAADGGDLVPTGHYNGIIERLRPQALYSQLGVRNIPGTGLTVNVPVDNESDSGAFVSTAESAAFDRDAPAVTKVAMTLVKYTKKVDLTYELMQDEDSRLMAFLNNYVANGMAATMNSLLVTEVLANGTAGLTLDAAAAIGAAEVPELLYKLSAEYARGPSVAWLMRRATEGYLRGLSSSNQFLFAPTPGGTGNGTAWGSLWGVPQYSDDNMGALGASGKSMVVGNWDYMGMRLAPDITFLLDPYSRAGYGETILHYYFRVDFAVLQAGAFQYATHPSA
ncbi:MAG: phage major capsid protein [Caldilineaceae bacterium]|nr:phage major capsid protein [Caldilineaceae bacterium]